MEAFTINEKHAKFSCSSMSSLQPCKELKINYRILTFQTISAKGIYIYTCIFVK